MGLLKPASNQTAYLKLGILGFEGSGKTFTAVDFAIGITKLTKGSKVAFFDTEKGSDFHIEKFKANGIQLDVVKSRSFKDLVDTIREAQAGGYSFLIIDSITHVWRDLVESWLKKKGRAYLTMKDWGVLKTEWGQYTDLYVNSKVHIAMLGRAGHEYDIDEDDEGNQEMRKSGTKMKVETETGYEPDLLLEMFTERIETKTKTKKGTTKTTKERGLINKCFIKKDRTDTINGKTFARPKFSDFKSVVSFLNIGGEHYGATQNDNTLNAFAKDDFSYHDKKRMKDHLLEEIQNALVLGGLDGRSDATKKARILFLQKHFEGQSSQEYITNTPVDQLQTKLESIKLDLGLVQKPNDGLPTAQEMQQEQLPI